MLEVLAGWVVCIAVAWLICDWLGYTEFFLDTMDEGDDK